MANHGRPIVVVTGRRARSQSSASITSPSHQLFKNCARLTCGNSRPSLREGASFRVSRVDPYFWAAHYLHARKGTGMCSASRRACAAVIFMWVFLVSWGTSTVFARGGGGGGGHGGGGHAGGHAHSGGCAAIATASEIRASFRDTQPALSSMMFGDWDHPYTAGRLRQVGQASLRSLCSNPVAEPSPCQSNRFPTAITV
jgi:hypothetical protein